MNELLDTAHKAGASTHESELAASLVNVSKGYKHFKLKGIDLQLMKGTVTGLIGPNGAGKSTTMRLLMGLIKPDQGRISVLGQEIASNRAMAKNEIGYFSDEMRLYNESIGWHMQFVRSLCPHWDEAYSRDLLDRFGLIESQTIKGLSHGQRVKTLLLLILARRPKLLILDEPTNGLDPVAKQEVLSELMRVVEDEARTILYSSHNTQDIEQISDVITFIDRGEVIASDNRDDFLVQWKRIRLQVAEGWVMPEISGLRLESTFRSLRVLSSNQFVDAIPSQLVSSGALVEGVEPMNLEEIFVSSVIRGREEIKK